MHACGLLSPNGWLIRMFVGSCLLLNWTGCGQPRYPNAEAEWPAPIAGEPAVPQDAYRFNSLALNPGNTDDIFVCLTFSGGGTRAAALAYGVLEELRDTSLPPLPDGRPRSLLDEVDAISSVSGGSFTALAFKLWGSKLFESPFAERFLYHNVTNDLVLRVLVQHLLILPIIFPERTHIAADYVNEQIFEHRSYADFTRQRPFVVVNATRMAGGRFEFTQDDFDLLGSDLNSVPLGHAAMASSAFPLLLSPMRLKYYRNQVSREALQQHQQEPGPGSYIPRRSRWAHQLTDAEAKAASDREGHRFLYLLDGGVFDNLGLCYVIDAFRHGVIHERLECPEDKQPIKHLVLIVVDASNDPPNNIEERRIAPGFVDMAARSAAIGVNSHSETTLEYARWLFQSPCHGAIDQARADESPDGKSSAAQGGYEPHVIDIKLQNVQDPARREMLLRLPTSLHLHDDEVDLLIAEARELLRTHSAFVNLKKRLNP